MKRRIEYTALLIACALGCGARVNLGERDPSGSETGDGGGSPGATDSPASQIVARLSSDVSFGTLVSAGEFLYLANFYGVHRCEKLDCLATLQRMPAMGSRIGSLQVYAGALGVSHGGPSLAPGPAWFATYSLPEGAEARVVLSDLPSESHPELLWHNGFVYWHMPEDSYVYRCALPACESGPQKVGKVGERFLWGSSILAEGELVFWADEFFIHRSADLGRAPAMTLLPDATLSEASADWQANSAGQSDWGAIHSLATADGMLYACVQPHPEALSCTENCLHEIVRWPVGGGAREVIVNSPQFVEKIFVFGDELVWTDARKRVDREQGAVLYSCLMEACEATRRSLGRVVAFLSTVVADETDLYWFEAGTASASTPGTTELTNTEIRRAPRLFADKD